MSSLSLRPTALSAIPSRHWDAEARADGYPTNRREIALCWNVRSYAGPSSRIIAKSVDPLRPTLKRPSKSPTRRDGMLDQACLAASIAVEDSL